MSLTNEEFEKAIKDFSEFDERTNNGQIAFRNYGLLCYAQGVDDTNKQKNEMKKAIEAFIKDLGKRHPEIYTEGPTCPYVRRLMEILEEVD